MTAKTQRFGRYDPWRVHRLEEIARLAAELIEASDGCPLCGPGDTEVPGYPRIHLPEDCVGLALMDAVAEGW